MAEAVAPLLELQAVDVYYGPIQALHELSITVREGELVCLLGGNASGKSTTMKTILGLVRPRAGQVHYRGQSIDHLKTPARIRLGIGSVPEARRIFPAMTVRENLLMGAYSRADRAAIREDEERVLGIFPRLRERLGQSGGTLSGGEQQMLAMARALMLRPRLICMDEPTMGLSPLFVDRVLDLIASINQSGVTIFMVEQNANLALQIADRGYVLRNGRIVLQGAARDLLANPEIRTAYLGEASDG